MSDPHITAYRASELIVLRLSAGPGRECFVLVHPLDGWLDALPGEGGAEYVVPSFVRSGAAKPVAELLARVTSKIDTSPSQYRHFLRRRWAGGTYEVV